jgi:SpoVK/Ycf46/Vps4 family AAA+-type ATPase
MNCLVRVLLKPSLTSEVLMQTSLIGQFADQLSWMVRARYSVILLQTCEEARCVDLVEELGKKREAAVYVWSRTQGIQRHGKPVADTYDPMAALKWFQDLNEKALFILKDFHPYLKDPGVTRKLRDLSHELKRTHKNVLLLSAALQVPGELSKEVAVLELPLPSRNEVESLVRKAGTILQKGELGAEEVECIVDAATGLTHDEVENVLAKSIVSRGKLDKLLIQDEKSQIVKRSGILEFVPTQENVTSIGGLEYLKSWLKVRRSGFSKEAKQLGLPLPKGILLVGIPGCGKSLTAMTVGREWQLPLLRLDMGRIFSGLVGSSESNIRMALSTCEAVAPCILWIDEIEKGLAGTKSSGSSDGGTTSRVFGTVLTWMQEKKSPVFVVATANDISQLPPEFLRKGRFDEIFFVDLPTVSERTEIFRIQLERYGWTCPDMNVPELIARMESFSGAEIEQVIIAARYLAFGNNEAFSQRHLLQTIDETVPLAKTMGDRIDGLRSWAQNRARPASRGKEERTGDRFELRTSSLELESRQPKVGEV